MTENVQNFILQADRIHQDNLNSYHRNKDELLASQATESFDKGLKTVLHIIGDIKDEKIQKRVFNEYNEHLREKYKKANLAIKDLKELAKKTRQISHISLCQSILLCILSIYLILKGF